MLPYKLVSGINFDVATELIARCRQHLFGKCMLLTVADYYERAGQRWLRLQEKRGKEHEVPVHSKAREAIDPWLEGSGLASNPAAPLFPAFGKDRETIELKHLDRRSILKLVEKRASASGIIKRVSCHSFRATGITEYMVRRNWCGSLKGCDLLSG